MSSSANQPKSRFIVQTIYFSQAPIAMQLHGLAEIGDYHAAKNIDQLADLIIAGRIVPLLPSDEVVVIDDAATALQIEVITGAAHGVQGWVPRPWLRPLAGALPPARSLSPTAAA